MATFKNTSMPSSSPASKRDGNGSRFVRTLFFLAALATVSAASIGTTWLVMTRTQGRPINAKLIAESLSAAVTSDAPASAPAAMAQAPAAEMNQEVVTSAVPDATRTEVPPPLPPAPIFYELAPFTVTVENEVAERILHVGITLRLADELSRKRLENYLPEVRSRVLLELSKLTPDDLQGSQGRVHLAHRIAETLNRPFAPQPVGQYVTDVLFTTFVVQ